MKIKKGKWSTQPMQDERIQSESNKYAAGAYYISFVMALGSSFIKGVILKRPLGDWGMEFLIFLIPALYLSIRLAAGGIPTFPKMKTKFEKKIYLIANIIGALIFGVIFGLSNDILPLITNGHFSIQGIIFSLISGLIFGGLMFMFPKGFDKYTEKRVNQKIRDDREDTND